MNVTIGGLVFNLDEVSEATFMELVFRLRLQNEGWEFVGWRAVTSG